MLDNIKSLLLLGLTGLLSIISDYQHAFIALLVGFTFNFLMGIGADAKDKSESFSLKKATEGFKLFMFYCITVLALYGMTYNEPTISATAIKWLTLVASYFYLVNIFRNARKIFPGNAAIEFIYLFLSTEVFFKLKELLNIKKDSTDLSDDFIKSRKFRNKRNDKRTDNE